MPKPNKEGWIRHRGGVPKCLDDINLIRTRHHGVHKIDSWFKPVMLNSRVFWKHFGIDCDLGDTDIMAYKLKEQLEP